ncbi:MAG: hypothetical protein LKG11_01655 [Bacilli bacterium]|nr:hypothetical protein [Bacilli bacterium]
MEESDGRVRTALDRKLGDPGREKRQAEARRHSKAGRQRTGGGMCYPFARRDGQDGERFQVGRQDVEGGRESHRQR